MIFPNLQSRAVLTRGNYQLSIINYQLMNYQDITLDLICQKSQCETEIWGFSQAFNQAEHDGIVNTIKKDNSWELQVKININSDPWRKGGEAEYLIELQPDKKDKKQIVGSYSGTFNEELVSGKVTGNITPYSPTKIPNHTPISPREHPRLIFRQNQLPELREKAKTQKGQAILAQLEKSLQQKIYYEAFVPNGGYHAAGHCFLSLLNDDPQAAETAWQIVEKSLNNPGPRLLEHAPIVAGVALAYDLCYNAWDEQRVQKITDWLAQQTKILIAGTRGKGWNPTAWSNWSGRARSAAGLAALAILYKPEQFFSEPTDVRRLLKIAERNIERYLETAVGDRSFGTEGDLYSIEPWILALLPFFQAYENVFGHNFVKDSSIKWFLPHYVMRIVGEDGEISVPTYGRHRLAPVKSLFSLGWNSVPEKFLPGVMWFFHHHFGWEGDRSFAIKKPHEAAFLLAAYSENLINTSDENFIKRLLNLNFITGLRPKNPAKVFERVLVDEEKGFYLFRNQWKDKNDFVASIYLKQQPLRASWSFPEAGGFRIWGLGGRWASAGPDDGKRGDENVVVVGDMSASGAAQPNFFQGEVDGSGVVSMNMDDVFKDNDFQSLRSFGVDYSGVSGAPGLFVVVDRFTGDAPEKVWVMHTQEQVVVEDNGFMLKANSGATMRGTFVTPGEVKLDVEETKRGSKILASGGDNFFVVMTVQNGIAPEVEIFGSGLDAEVRVGERMIIFREDRVSIINN
ncbi:hypothetical protein AFK68_12830 [Hydrocoleum sp. CS-953]|uniref:hypothetical protein n=1 Tax=Hydrocoleum sp. CS-953 TaxID=1671698 RepID=UPI000B9AE72E|nr:hypothetical protein [Hydrocoleum sp. CS-953]OZH54136.1 hypothetical protein AFK68_12830 [Hydrocoleum sp. CS-953]